MQPATLIPMMLVPIFMRVENRKDTKGYPKIILESVEYHYYHPSSTTNSGQRNNTIQNSCSIGFIAIHKLVGQRSVPTKLKLNFANIPEVSLKSIFILS